VVGELPANWAKEMPSTTGEHCGMEAEENQWALGQHQQPRRHLKAQAAAWWSTSSEC